MDVLVLIVFANTQFNFDLTWIGLLNDMPYFLVVMYVCQISARYLN